VSGARERRYLEHIAESVDLIEEYVRGGRPAFFEHRQVQDAVLRRLEILADATAQLSPELKDRHREILERVWEIVTDHLPPYRHFGPFERRWPRRRSSARPAVMGA
jgi:deoxyribodipyrimidine photolyase